MRLPKTAIQLHASGKLFLLRLWVLGVGGKRGGGVGLGAMILSVIEEPFRAVNYRLIRHEAAFLHGGVAAFAVLERLPRPALQDKEERPVAVPFAQGGEVVAHLG